MSWNVLSGKPLHKEAQKILEDFSEITISTSYEGDESLDSDIDRFDAIIAGNELPLSQDWIQKASNLKVITSRGVGIDPVDVSAATEEMVLVCNNPGKNTQAVAEYTIAVMLAVRRKLLQADRDMRNGIWKKHGYMGPELEGQTMGVLGYGAIGSLVLEFAEGLRMEGKAFDPYTDPDKFADSVESVDSVLELFKQSDIVSIHAPLTDETRGLVGYDELCALGSSGIVVNAARGGIINEEDLVKSLKEKDIWGAGVDVFEKEPAPKDHPLFDLNNVIVTPHMAGSTQSSVPAKDRGAAENIKSIYDRKIPDSTINAEELCMAVTYGDSAGDSTSLSQF